MPETIAFESPNLGFLTVLHEPQGYLGGYLVTNLWGRPLDFRLSTAVQPNRVQQILYGGTLSAYLHADLIGGTLFEKTSTPAHVVLTDLEPVLDLRLRVGVPVAWLAPPADPVGETLARGGALVRPAANGAGPVVCHPRFPEDGKAVRAIIDRLDGVLDLAEPFSRIRQAVGEARRMGVASRG